MRMRSMAVPLLALALALGACEAPERPVTPDVLARAAGIDFTAEEAAELLAPQAQLPAQPVVVDALANLWVDYFLLARTTALDSTLANLDLSPLIRVNVDQELVLTLREEVIQVDTTFSEEEVRQIFEAELPGARVRARHILLRIPVGATQAEEDSVRALASELRSRLLNGESFALLAGEFSQDPGSASSGGDLGIFGRGEMVPPFEEAVFSLEAGEVSEVVETNFGLHIIQVDERVNPSAEENLEGFRVQLQNRRIEEAESTFVAGIVQDGNVQVHPDGFETARQVASEPNTPLTERALNRTLVSFRGGEITLGDYRNWVDLRGSALRDQIRNSTDEQMDGLLQNLARERLLVRTARDRGIEVPQAKQDSLATQIRDGVRNLIRQVGFDGLGAADAASADSVALEAAREFLQRVVARDQQVIPLGGIAVALRRQHNARVFDAGKTRALERLNELRAQLPTPPPASGPDTLPGGTPAPDSVGAPAGGRNP